MSNLGKLVVIGAIGAVAYFKFYKHESIPGTDIISETSRTVIKDANADYVEHKIGTEKEYMDRNATVLQDAPSMRAITKNKE
ncbi:hypothetical protein [Helicobacter sp. 23-1045]